MKDARQGSWGTAWVLLSVALAIHVVDEAANDFLAFYNPVARAIRSEAPWIPLPTFSFEVWIAGLTAAVAALLALSPFAYRDAKWLRPLGYFFAALMLGNGLLHIASSVSLARWVAGVYSSPLLLAASAYLILQLRRNGKNPPAPDS